MVLVMGAGAVGCFLGGLLQASGQSVVYVGRPKVLEPLASHGLTLTDLDSRQNTIAGRDLRLFLDLPSALGSVGDQSSVEPPAVTLLCVKAGATPAAAQLLESSLPAGSVVVSMQNGIGQAALAQSVAPSLCFLDGMVSFNIANLGDGRYHRGTAGFLAATDHPVLRPVAEAFKLQQLKLRLVSDMRPIQWGKLLLNLNNPVNALSGMPLREELMQAGYRRCLAALQEEALHVLRAAAIEPAQLTAVTPQKFLRVLRLPTFLFRLVARQALKIDAKARSSMADDLSAGRLTEIAWLCGEVQRLAHSVGLQAPLNARMQALVEAWPQRGAPYAPRQLIQALGI
jgi:2-dehydropantoate 2-reductase